MSLKQPVHSLGEKNGVRPKGAHYFLQTLINK